MICLPKKNWCPPYNQINFCWFVHLFSRSDKYKMGCNFILIVPVLFSKDPAFNLLRRHLLSLEMLLLPIWHTAPVPSWIGWFKLWRRGMTLELLFEGFLHISWMGTRGKNILEQPYFFWYIFLSPLHTMLSCFVSWVPNS